MARGKITKRSLQVEAGFATDCIKVTEANRSDTVDQVPDGSVGVDLYSTGAGVLYVDTEGAANREIPVAAGSWTNGLLLYRIRDTGATAGGPYFVKIAPK